MFTQYKDLDLLVVQTRSPLAERDFALMANIPYLWLSITIETDNQDYLLKFKGGPPIAKRLAMARQAVEQQHARSRRLARDLLRHDLEQAFGISTLTLLHAQIVDGRADGDDARALISYRFPYELRPDRTSRLWVLTLLDAGVSGVGVDGDQACLLRYSWTLDERVENAVVTLWCAIAELAARWLANQKEQ